MRRQFECKCPTRRECQPDSSAREDRLPRALLSAHFVRHRQKPRSPERLDPPIAPFDIVHGVPTFVLSCLTYVHTHFTVYLLLCVYFVYTSASTIFYLENGFRRRPRTERTLPSLSFPSFSTISILTFTHLI